MMLLENISHSNGQTPSNTTVLMILLLFINVKSMPLKTTHLPRPLLHGHNWPVHVDDLAPQDVVTYDEDGRTLGAVKVEVADQLAAEVDAAQAGLELALKCATVLL